MRTYAGAETLYRASWTETTTYPDGRVYQHEEMAGPYESTAPARAAITRAKRGASRWSRSTVVTNELVEKTSVAWEAVE